jgi:hypothetical protein
MLPDFETPAAFRAGADEEDVARLHADAGVARAAGEIVGGDRVVLGKRVHLLPPRDVEQDAACEQRRDRLGAVLRVAVGALGAIDRHAAVELQIARLVAQRVDVRAAVLHHRQDPGRSGARAVLVGPVRVAVAPVQAVVVPRLVRRVDRHPRKPGLLQIEHPRAKQPLPERRRRWAGRGGIH